MPEKILFVDDESAILQGYTRLFRNEFEIDTSVTGKGALIAIETNGPYAVVVSDMQMPEMSGVEVLRKVKEIAPDSIRIILTGHADLSAAIAAVNDGSVFRFLTKPCSKEILGKTLSAGLIQYRLVRAERELLEHTLKGSIEVLSEVLSIVNPAAFSRAMRLKRYMKHVVAMMKLPRPWRFEVAAMMSQLGCVVLAPETIEAVFAGRELSPEEQARYASHPDVARSLLENIPRMEPIAWMIAHQNRPTSVDSDITDREMADMRLGADLLQVTIAFDDLLRKGRSRLEAANQVIKQYRHVDQKVVFSLIELDPEREENKGEPCAIEELSVGMVLAKNVYSKTGALVVTEGQQLTSTLILKLKNLLVAGGIDDSVFIVTADASAAAATAL
ncbi:MAG TPA: HD domain-containing phosphohydrolase [Terriglobales bacterium]|nr:HD domain-containing phosphohydrolase [Terriglobales bacterium]